MILKDDDVLQRLNSPENIINLLDGQSVLDKADTQSLVKVEPLDTSGRGKRGSSVPTLIRRLIAQTKDSDETQAEIGAVFGVGVPTVSNSQRGLIHNRFDKELAEIGATSAKDKANTAHEAALDNLMIGLSVVSEKLNPDHLTGLSLKEASKLTVDMSRVVAQLKPREEDEAKVKTLVVIKMPSVKRESQFETIDVN